MSDNPDFSLSHPAIGLRNRDRFGSATFGQCEVKAGPWQFTAYVAADGGVNLPSGLADQELRFAISSAVRKIILQETRDRWAAVEQWEVQRLKELSRPAATKPPPASKKTPVADILG